MEKGDWYFLVGTLLGLSAFFGIDWKRIRGGAAMQGIAWRGWLTLVLIVASLAFSGFGWYHAEHSEYEKLPRILDLKPGDLKRVENQTFINETVDVDGKDFEHCTFINVRLFSHGKANAGFQWSEFRGSLVLATDDDRMQAFGELMSTFGYLQTPQQGVTWLSDKNGYWVARQFENPSTKEDEKKH